MNACLRQLKPPTVICSGYALYTKVSEVALPSRRNGLLNYTSGRCKYMDRHNLMETLHGIIKTLIFLATYFLIITDLCFSIRQQMDKITLLYDIRHAAEYEGSSFHRNVVTLQC
jgi:hypothetical protein